MNKKSFCVALFFFGLSVSLFAQTLVPNQAVPDDPKRLVEGVALDVYQSVQLALSEVASADKTIAGIDDQMEMLREQRADLCFKAAVQAHPELKDALTTVREKQKERRLLEKTQAREAKRAAKKKG